VRQRPWRFLRFAAMRVMFFGYLTVIVSGIAFFSIIGLIHH
jgi:hypothetical protein